MRMKKWLMTMLFLSVYFCYGQGGRVVTGSVIDSVGPVPYATISEVARNNNVTADAQGKFTITLTY